MDKIRVVLTHDCNRYCVGCCNADHNLPDLPVIEQDFDYSPYREVILTGGEPMLNVGRLVEVISQIRKTAPDSIIILYTTKTKPLKDIVDIIGMLDAITITLHEPYDVKPFKKLNQVIEGAKPLPLFEGKSLRVNVFSSAGEFDSSEFPLWNSVTEKEWIENCPLPDGEYLVQYGGAYPVKIGKGGSRAGIPLVNLT